LLGGATAEGHPASGTSVPYRAEESLRDRARLEALDRLDILDTPAEATFDRFTCLAQRILGVPVSLVSFISGDRHFFKSQSGLQESVPSAGEIPLSHSFCKYVVATGEPLVVEDAREHPLVWNNAAIEDLSAIAYLGVPICGPSGHVLGSFSAVDSEPRGWSEDDLQLLTDLTASVESELALRAEIAERRKAEAALRTRERHYRALFEAANDAILVLDPDSEVVLAANERAGAMYGLAVDDLVGVSLKTLSVDTEFGDRKVEEMIGGATRTRFETLQSRSDGTPINVLVSASLIEFDGQPAILSINRDVTHERQTSEALRQSEQRYRDLVDNMQEVIGQIDAEGRWEFLNPAWETITGFSVAETTGRPAAAYAHPDDTEEVERHLGRLLSGEADSVCYELRNLTADGSYRWVEVRAQLRHGQDGEFAGFSGILRDISDTKRFEAERTAREAAERAQAEAEDLLRLKESLFQNMSHELRTPLTGILGFAEVLAEEVEPEQSEAVEVIYRSARRLMDTLNSVLDLAQIESGNLAIRLEQIDVGAVAAEVVELLRPLAQRKGLAFRFETDPAARAQADAAMLYRVVANLTGNALKFTERGEVAIEVAREEGATVLRVRDTGVGIGPAFKERLFEAFRQESDGLSRSHEGSGLGLAITHRLVEMMGGTIEVESEKGRGSVFTVRLPVAEGA
jgi:PAS domain S-box-containing protein